MRKFNLGTFTLGGVPWKIEIDNETCSLHNSVYISNPTKQIIKLRDSFEGGTNLLSYRNIMKNFWQAVLNEIIYVLMEYRKYATPYITTPYSSFVFQVIESLSSKPEEWDGHFNVGGKSYKVIVDNRRAEEWFGKCYGDEGTIMLTTEREGEKYSDSFILQTLWHEILHAIAHELGLGDSKINSEKFVNTLSIFIVEILKTLKIKFPDE